jgi:hypothetical protein
MSRATILSLRGGHDTKNRHFECKVVQGPRVGAIAAPSRAAKPATPLVLSIPKAGDHRLIESG